MQTKKFRIQANNSVMYGYLSIGFIDFMLVGKNLIEYTSLFFLYNFLKNYNIILICFKIEWFKQSEHDLDW